MSSETENLDRLLRDFLEQQAEERSKGITLESLHRAVTAISNDRIKDRQMLAKALMDFREEFTKRFENVEDKVDRYGRRIKSLETKVTEMSDYAEGVEKWEPDERDVTGSFHLQQMIVEREERKSDARWLKRKGVEWLMAAFGAFLLLLINVLVTLYITSHAAPATPPPAPPSVEHSPPRK